MAQIFNILAEFVFSIAMPSKEAKSKIEKKPVNAEAKRRKH